MRNWGRDLVKTSFAAGLDLLCDSPHGKNAGWAIASLP